MNTKTISPQELARLQTAGQPIALIDVRTPLEFRTVHIGFAKNIPLDQLDEAKISQVASKGDPIYVICHSGGRAAKACEQLAAWGLQDAVSIEGGTSAWMAAGLPVQRDVKVISLERQVRMAAGSLVVLGCVLALTVHIGFTALAIFVGCGLVFAGLTDTCGMGLILAKMPWNKAAGECPACYSSK